MYSGKMHTGVTCQACLVLALGLVIWSGITPLVTGMSAALLGTIAFLGPSLACLQSPSAKRTLLAGYRLLKARFYPCLYKINETLYTQSV